jgi:aminoglycoside 6'-N-acetyltransferase I
MADAHDPARRIARVAAGPAVSDAGGGSEVIVVRVLGPGDDRVLDQVAPGVFDDAVDARLAAEFLSDPRHHLAVALDGMTVVGMASAVHYVHPDKPPELWINEVGVAPTHRRRGCGRKMLRALLSLGRRLGCAEAWVLTEPGNRAAQNLYRAVGGRKKRTRSVMFEFSLKKTKRRIQR